MIINKTKGGNERMHTLDMWFINARTRMIKTQERVKEFSNQRKVCQTL